MRETENALNLLSLIRLVAAWLCLIAFLAPGYAFADDSESRFKSDILPILAAHCFDCHADGASEGNLSFDELFAIDNQEHANETWHAVLKQVQAGLMPPADEDQLTNEQVASLRNWIKYDAFGINPQMPDPGHVTLRRLNQVEYRNAIRDLIGVDYDTTANFPADDTGHGFDNIGAVLSLSPLLLEKYVNAAEEIVSSAVPTVSRVIQQQSLLGDKFQLAEQASDTSGDRSEPGTLEMSYYNDATAQANVHVQYPGEYTVRLNITANETYRDNQFDENRCEFSFALDGEVLLTQTFVRQGRKAYVFDFPLSLTNGDHKVVATSKPLSELPQIRRLRIQIQSVDLIGPQQPEYFVKPEGYENFFPRDVPTDEAEKLRYARELLGGFATRAFRRPVDDGSLDRLVALSESVYGEGDASFESGIAKSMTAILASPRFLFREESSVEGAAGTFPLVDEYSLAPRLSFFLWSTMPDDELSSLAAEGKLRANLDAQVARMLNDDKAKAFSENFVGQWLRARAVDSIQINASAVLSREPSTIDPESDIRRHRFFALFRKGIDRTEDEEREYEKEKAIFLDSFDGESNFELTRELRTAMRLETEMLFEHIVKNDRNLLELVDCDYTFLNETLWSHYQIQGVGRIQGDQMRLVQLPKDSHRGGVLTQGSTLVVTSNPDRTSPVKRGLFILENLLGTPPAAPPPNIPALEDVESEATKPLSLRESLALHRENALCSSCHNQMDPLGLALENFNALGIYRTEELGQPIESAGQLSLGESFKSIDQLKRILANNRKTEIYRCITEKMMTYALGRAVEYSDAHTVDEIVDALEANDGRISELINGIIRSNAFQRTRTPKHNLTQN